MIMGHSDWSPLLAAMILAKRLVFFFRGHDNGPQTGLRFVSGYDNDPQTGLRFVSGYNIGPQIGFRFVSGYDIGALIGLLCGSRP